MLWDCTLPQPHSSPANTTSSTFEVHRLKGILALTDTDSNTPSTKIIQAVRDVFEIRDSERPPQSDDSESGKPPCCKIVLIGRGLGRDAGPWQESFEAFLLEGSE